MAGVCSFTHGNPVGHDLADLARLAKETGSVHLAPIYYEAPSPHKTIQ